MNTRSRSSLQSVKAPNLKHGNGKVDARTSWMMNAEKTPKSRRGSVRERKVALQQDVDKLKKRLRHEENVHRALERAFTRPLGALPRLPAYLPANTLELLAEVAVLEEEVVRLEEKVVHFRQGLYQEAVYVSSSKKNMDNLLDLCEPAHIKDPKLKPSRSSFPNDTNLAAVDWKKSASSLSDEKRGHENQSGTNSLKNKQQSSPNLKRQSVRTPRRRNPKNECRLTERRCNPQKLQFQTCEPHHGSPEAKNQEEISVDDTPNKVSESILKCLMIIFLRMSSKKRRGPMGTMSSLSSVDLSESNAEFKDPYGTCSESGERDVGPYKHLFSVEAPSINSNRISIFLVQRLKVLLQKLAAVELRGLPHQEKLAFWINVYNSCMMNAFIEYGIPESPEMIVTLMHKATVNVGGHILNAITIEHFILRLPYHSELTFSKSEKFDEMTTGQMFGLELSEPLVMFALSCGSWSSPAVRVYTASQVEKELETAKNEYLQAAVGISRNEKLILIPKLLDWYLLYFAKDIDSLLDWICLQLPNELREDAMKCLETRKKDEPFLKSFLVMPYEFRFRYLLHT